MSPTVLNTANDAIIANGAPRRLAMRSPTKPPTIEPMAISDNSNPYPRPVTPSSSAAYLTNIASPNIAAILAMPSMIASVRMSLFAQSHLMPSTKSSLKDCRCKRAAVRSSGGILIVATRAAAKANDAALAPNGSPTAATNAQAPSGRPIKLLAITSAVYRRPFAFSSNSVGTIAGRNACADMSKMTSQQPTPSKMNINDQMVSEPCQALKAMIEYSTVRTTFTAIIKCLRLNLSI